MLTHLRDSIHLDPEEGYFTGMLAAATPPTQFGSEKARGRPYLRLLVDF